MNAISSILSDEMWLALESGFAEQLAGITQPVAPEPVCRERLRIATPLTHIATRPIPTDRDEFTRDGDSSGV